MVKAWMSTQEAAADLGVSTGRVRQLLLAGQLPGEKLGRGLGIPETWSSSTVGEPRLRPSRGGVMEFLDWASRTVAKGMLPGPITGLIVGGVGSRVAMRVMAITSPAARGVKTDLGPRWERSPLGAHCSC